MSVGLVAFRVDASQVIGTGHVERCITLGAALKRLGNEIVFVSRYLPQHMIEKILEAGFRHIPLHSNRQDNEESTLAHRDWLGVSQSQDARDFVDAVCGLKIDTIVVDHYALDYVWELAVKRVTKSTFVIDDLADRRHECEYLLDQNLRVGSQGHYTDLVPASCKLLLGPQYCLLRDEFLRHRSLVQPRNGVISNVLVFFGGVDLGNYTALAIEALACASIKNLIVNVVIGKSHPDKALILELCEKHAYSCHIQTTLMAQLMAEAEFGIGAAGSASWERCSLGLPAMTFVVSANQTAIAEALSSVGAIDYDAAQPFISVENIRDRLMILVGSPERCHTMSKIAYSLVDGLGVQRVCDELGVGG